MCPCEKEEWLILFGISRLKLIAQTEPPLVFQLQPHDCLTQSTAVWADYAQSCPYVSERWAIKTKTKILVVLQSHTEESLKHLKHTFDRTPCLVFHHSSKCYCSFCYIVHSKEHVYTYQSISSHVHLHLWIIHTVWPKVWTPDYHNHKLVFPKFCNKVLSLQLYRMLLYAVALRLPLHYIWEVQTCSNITMHLVHNVKILKYGLPWSVRRNSSSLSLDLTFVMN